MKYVWVDRHCLHYIFISCTLNKKEKVHLTRIRSPQDVEKVGLPFVENAYWGSPTNWQCL